jgi:hypothetical protein
MTEKNMTQEEKIAYEKKKEEKVKEIQESNKINILLV